MNWGKPGPPILYNGANIGGFAAKTTPRLTDPLNVCVSRYRSALTECLPCLTDSAEWLLPSLPVLASNPRMMTVFKECPNTENKLLTVHPSNNGRAARPRRRLRPQAS